MVSHLIIVMYFFFLIRLLLCIIYVPSVLLKPILDLAA